MNFSSGSFEPDNIMRYVNVIPLGAKGYTIRVIWSEIINLVVNSNLPINSEIFEKVCEDAINKHICIKFMAPKNQPDKTRILRYMTALVIFGCAEQMIKMDAINPTLAGDNGYDDVPEEHRSEDVGDLMVGRRLDDIPIIDRVRPTPGW